MKNHPPTASTTHCDHASNDFLRICGNSGAANGSKTVTTSIAVCMTGW